jgi:hypothetical protein
MCCVHTQFRNSLALLSAFCSAIPRRPNGATTSGPFGVTSRRFPLAAATHPAAGRAGRRADAGPETADHPVRDGPRARRRGGCQVDGRQRGGDRGAGPRRNPSRRSRVRRALVRPRPARSPAADPKFQALRKDVNTKKRTVGSSHPPATTEAGAAQAASEPPADDREARGKAAHAEDMDAAEPKAFDKQAFMRRSPRASSARRRPGKQVGTGKEGTKSRDEETEPR